MAHSAELSTRATQRKNLHKKYTIARDQRSRNCEDSVEILWRGLTMGPRYDPHVIMEIM